MVSRALCHWGLSLWPLSYKVPPSVSTASFTLGSDPVCRSRHGPGPLSGTLACLRTRLPALPRNRRVLGFAFSTRSESFSLISPFFFSSMHIGRNNRHGSFESPCPVFLSCAFPPFLILRHEREARIAPPDFVSVCFGVSFSVRISGRLYAFRRTRTVGRRRTAQRGGPSPSGVPRQVRSRAGFASLPGRLRHTLTRCPSRAPPGGATRGPGSRGADPGPPFVFFQLLLFRGE